MFAMNSTRIFPFFNDWKKIFFHTKCLVTDSRIFSASNPHSKQKIPDPDTRIVLSMCAVRTENEAISLWRTQSRCVFLSLYLFWKSPLASSTKSWFLVVVVLLEERWPSSWSFLQVLKELLKSLYETKEPLLSFFDFDCWNISRQNSSAWPAKETMKGPKRGCEKGLISLCCWAKEPKRSFFVKSFFHEFLSAIQPLESRAADSASSGAITFQFNAFFQSLINHWDASIKKTPF